jgi:hypothetical protein
MSDGHTDFNQRADNYLLCHDVTGALIYTGDSIWYINNNEFCAAKIIGFSQSREISPISSWITPSQVPDTLLRGYSCTYLILDNEFRILLQNGLLTTCKEILKC